MDTYKPPAVRRPGTGMNLGRYLVQTQLRRYRRGPCWYWLCVSIPVRRIGLRIAKPEQMPTREEIHAARMYDALRWVSQEARAVVMSGTQLPAGSRLREALEQLTIVSESDL